MSHIGARIVADWLKDATHGLNAIAAQLPYDGADTPPDPATVYDGTRDGWVARLRLPHPDAAGMKVQYPACVVAVVSAAPDDGAPVWNAAAGVVEGSVTLAFLLLVRNADSAKAATDQMYLVRALRGALLLFHTADNAARTRLGVRLERPTSVQRGDVPELPEDLLVPEVLLVTYPTLETTPLPPPT